MLSVLLKKDSVLKMFQFDRTELSIGRVAENDIVLDNERVSKRHAKVIINAGQVVLFDLNSTNGVFVNNIEVRGSRIIKPKDQVMICENIIRLKYVDGKTVASTNPRLGGMSKILNADPNRHDEQFILDEYETAQCANGKIDIRALLLKMFRTDSDFDAFCIDQFPYLYQKMSAGMDRVQRTNMILLDMWSAGQDMVQLLVEQYTALYYENIQTSGSGKIKKRLSHG